MSKLTNTLIHKGFLKSDTIIDAFVSVERVEFVPKRFRDASEADIPIPLGFGQIMPAPSIVAYMLELLIPKSGDRILVAGSGSGWVSAVLCHIVGKDGHVTSCDTSAPLEAIARENTSKFSFIERDHIIDFSLAEDCATVEKNGMFDCIIVLNPHYVQCALEHMIDVNGRIVMPKDNAIQTMIKNQNGELDVQLYDGMQFLPD